MTEASQEQIGALRGGVLRGARTVAWLRCATITTAAFLLPVWLLVQALEGGHLSSVGDWALFSGAMAGHVVGGVLLGACLSVLISAVYRWAYRQRLTHHLRALPPGQQAAVLLPMLHDPASIQLRGWVS